MAKISNTTYPKGKRGCPICQDGICKYSNQLEEQQKPNAVTDYFCPETGILIKTTTIQEISDEEFQALEAEQLEEYGIYHEVDLQWGEYLDEESKMRIVRTRMSLDASKSMKAPVPSEEQIKDSNKQQNGLSAFSVIIIIIALILIGLVLPDDGESFGFDAIGRLIVIVGVISGAYFILKSSRS